MRMLGSMSILVAVTLLAPSVSAGPMTSLRPQPVHRSIPPVPGPVSPPTSAIRTDLPGPNVAPAGLVYQHRRMPATSPHARVKHHTKRSRSH